MLNEYIRYINCQKLKVDVELITFSNCTSYMSSKAPAPQMRSTFCFARAKPQRVKNRKKLNQIFL